MTQPAASRTSGMAIAGFVTAFFCGLVGIVLSAIGLSQTGQPGVKGRGLAIAGICISIVNLIIPILAAVAIPAFVDYMDKGTRNEATRALDQMRYRLEGLDHLPRGTVDRTPRTACCAQPSHRCEPAFDDWNDPIWMELGFMPSSRNYQFTYDSDGAQVTVRAIGDLDCDGTEVTYELRGELENGRVHVHPIRRPTTAD